MYFFYEDPDILVHRRVEDVARAVIEASELLGEPEETIEANEKLRSNLLVLAADVLDNGDWQFVRKNKKFDEVKTTKLADYLREFIKARGVDLLVFDTGSEIHAAEENSAPEMVVLMRVLRQLAASTNTAILVIQHVSKQSMEKRLYEINQAAIRGSSVLVDKCRNVFYLTRMPRADAPSFGLEVSAETTEQYVVLKHLKANMGEYVKQIVFVRGSRGLLHHQSGIVEQDPGLVDTEQYQQKTEEKASHIVAEYARLIDIVVAFVKEHNDDGETVSKYQAQVNLEMVHGISHQKAISAVYGAVQSGRLISLKPLNARKLSSAKLVMKGHPMLKKHQKNGDTEFGIHIED